MVNSKAVRSFQCDSFSYAHLIAIALLLPCTVAFKGLKTDDCGSPGWIPFRDTKCYKVLTPPTIQAASNLKTYSQAMRLCAQEHEFSNLPSLESPEELEFVLELVQGSTLGNIWLGASEIKGSLMWNDGLKSNYTNWHEDDLRNRTSGNRCVQVETHPAFHSKWTFASCESKYNFAICQKPQNWPPSKIQRETRKNRLDLAQIMEKLNSQNARLEGEISNLHQQVHRLIEELDAFKISNMSWVPVGFIYVQYGSQVPPLTLWPMYSWLEVTSQYAGQFFRAEGGQSARFGSTQGYSVPRITQVTWYDYSTHPTSVSLNPGETSGAVRSGIYGSDQVGLSFTMSSDEVRPYNSAIKIWKRTA